MRAVQIAFLLLCIQVGGGIVSATGLFNSDYYETSIATPNFPSNISAQSDTEQSQGSINVMNTVFNTLTWGWISTYFEPLYSNNATVKNFIDIIELFLGSISAFIIGVALIEFVRDKINILGG